MGLLDKPTIAEEVQAIRTKRYNDKIKKEHLKKMGLAPLRKYKRRTFKMPKSLRKEWGERMNFLRSI